MHDAMGRELRKGDHVVILAKITELQPTDDFCNVGIETVLGRRPDGMKEHVTCINTGVLIKSCDG